MRIAFYAPLKPPDSDRPSGDRTMARLLIRALRSAGHEVDLASRMRSRDGAGDPERQARLAALGARLAARYVAAVRAGRRPAPDAWFTYHLYYKAPDWIGPAVADALGIPYAVAEVSVAAKRAGGPWDIGHRGTLAALARADLAVGLNSRDAAKVEPALGPGGRYERLRPFLEPGEPEPRDAARAQVGGELGLPADEPWLLAVGMMRPGAKAASYGVLGDALARVPDRRWRLLVAGDGPVRPEVEAALAPFGDRVRWAGAVDPARLARLYAAADLLVWPAIQEAYGMALLEAQAAGLPVLAGAAGGVPDIVRDGTTGLLVPEGDAAAFAAALRALLDDPDRRRAMGGAARRTVLAEHTLAGAAATLDVWLRAAVERRRTA
ncbi:glycosyl transferase family 1 [Thalassobaculum fulvum]|uniref:Glycosyl transferase family 1 n=1 Tax=Thalassobaculum fulvum TaxID=1633335 RepID=A0A919CM74_9PROT|nr:glycosyltransferase family 4 protein [Thalassobaculum fulvum]GHD39357.1 glycosyl transferase family 1 [Thalassobaculum fulvum]